MSRRPTTPLISSPFSRGSEPLRCCWTCRSSSTGSPRPMSSGSREPISLPRSKPPAGWSPGVPLARWLALAIRGKLAIAQESHHLPLLPAARNFDACRADFRPSSSRIRFRTASRSSCSFQLRWTAKRSLTTCQVLAQSSAPASPKDWQASPPKQSPQRATGEQWWRSRARIRQLASSS